MTTIFRVIASSSVFKWLMWLLFAALFYKSGETFTVWIIEPEDIGGGVQWIWVLLFPLMVPLFLVVNRRLGCASGSCLTGGSRIDTGGFPGH